MADVSESPSQSPIPMDETPSPSKPAKKATKQVNKKSIAAKKSTSKPSHPATSQLVLNAIMTLQDRNGSSLQAIKKFIASHYKLDTNKLATFIKKYLKKAVAAGKLIQTKGKGASGSFKLPTTMAAKGKMIAESSDKKIKSDEKKEKKRKEKSTKKTSSGKKKHTTSKRVSNKSGVSIKSAIPKQKSIKPSKVASKVKAPKNKKASSVKKTASASGTEKKTPKTVKQQKKSN